jgi:valyl-tRNA synthetase
MSKSLGNGIDPLDIAKEFGADAGRMALVMGTAAGTDSKISVDKIKGYKHFANKLWNITRFILGYAPEDLVEKPEIVERDSVLLSKFEEVAKEITDELDKYNFHLAAEKIYHYLWSHFADIIIEESKEVFKSGSQTEMRSRAYTLFKILSESLKVLHPFMPFVTEEIWTTIHPNENPLLVQRWPIK